MLSKREKFDMVLAHMRRVEQNCNIIALKMLDTNEEFACQLAKRGRTHDISKLNNFEWEHLWSWDDKFADALKSHRYYNSHHLEYWSNDPSKIGDLDVAEMVCDCAARATEFGTDLRNWFERPEYKHLKARIDYYVDLLLQKPFVYPKV
jgi:hypothetical protein